MERLIAKKRVETVRPSCGFCRLCQQNQSIQRQGSDDVWCFNNTILKDFTKPITNDCCSLVADAIIPVRHITLHNSAIKKTFYQVLSPNH